MSLQITIGEWVEKESRDVTQCPSYYAADTETLRTQQKYLKSVERMKGAPLTKKEVRSALYHQRIGYRAKDSMIILCLRSAR